MNPDHDNFQNLRRLLALKRHEAPPPGFFEGFSRQVIVRIRLDQEKGAESFWARLFGEGDWLQRFWGTMETQPGLAGAFTLGLCGLLAYGIFYSGKGDSAVPSVPSWAVADPAGTGFLEPVASAPAPSPLSQMVGAGLSSTAGIPAPSAQPSLFQPFKEDQRPWIVPAAASLNSLGSN